MKQFQKVYLDIITQTWNRFQFDDLVKATALVTNNFHDVWVSAKGPGEPTGKKVLAKMNDSAFKTYGKELVQTGGLYDSNEVLNYGGSTQSSNYYSGNVSWDRTSILNYWKAKAASGDEFSMKIKKSIQSHAGQDNAPVLASQVGLLAFAIWKACNSRVVRQEANIQSLETQGINLTEQFPYGKKLEGLNLVLTGVKNEVKRGYGYYAKETYSDIVYGKDLQTGITYKIKPGVKDKVAIYLVSYFYQQNSDHLQIPEGDKAIKLVVNGKVKGTYPQYKMVSLNYAEIVSPTPEEVEALRIQLKEQKEIQRQEKIAKRRQKAQTVIQSLGGIYEYDVPEDQNEKRNINNMIMQQRNQVFSDNDKVYFRIGRKVYSIEYKKLKEIALTPTQQQYEKMRDVYFNELKIYDFTSLLQNIRPLEQ